MPRRIIARRPLTVPERILGRRRVRVLRRRAGMLAVGVGLSLLRPKPRRWSPPVRVAALVIPAALTLAALLTSAR